MKEKYEVLEYHKLINELMEKSYLESTKERFIDLEIYKNKSDLDKEFSLLLEMIDFYKYDDGLELNSISNIERFVKPISILGNYLEIEDIFQIRKNLTIFRNSKTRAKNVRDKYKTIWNYFKDVEDLKNIEIIINEVIDDKGELKDDASISLREIRKQKKIIISNIQEKFNNLINSHETQKAIQDKIITKRNDRYVIAVKTDFKGLVKGIEHDSSSSGMTSFIEPLNVVSLNNKLREYEVKEREEIRKIQLRITEILRNQLEEVIKIINFLKDLDFLNAKIIYSIENNCNIPKIVSSIKLTLIEARHPFIDKEKVVPISFELEENENILLITGPNTGGKTVSLKVAGLLTIMALSGIPIPASEKSTIGMFDEIYSDIGDEQSLEQNLSSFSSHVSSIANILKNSTSKSLILLDELGSGTDPSEGSAFAMAIIDTLLEKKSKCLITTHYSEVKAYAFNNQGIKSASMEFNLTTLNPTYKLLVGIPGKSNALIIAQKYGIDDEIIKKANTYISDDNQKVEKMLLSIKEKNDNLEIMNLEIKKLKEELSLEKNKYEEKIKEIEIEKQEILKKSYKEAEDYVKDMQNKAKALIDKINKENNDKEEIKKLQKNMNMIAEYIKENKKKEIKVQKYTKSEINFEMGEEVFIKSLNQNGKIIRIIPEKASLLIQSGILKLSVNINDVEKVEKKIKKNTFNLSRNIVSEVQGKIDVRGNFAEDAIEKIDIYLNRAILTGYSTVSIVHGKGTMVLRKKIHEYLKKSILVKEFKDGLPNEGGLGVTIVSI